MEPADVVTSESLAEAAPAAKSPPDRSGSQPRGMTVTGLLVVGLVSAIWVGLLVQGQYCSATTWLPLAAAMAGLALVVALAGPRVLAGPYQKILLTLFALLTIWTAASVFWAGSQANAWQETNRTLFYALGLVLTFSAVRWAGLTGLKAVAAAVTVIAAGVCTWLLVGLNLSAEPMELFVGGRLNYPITYFNGLAALLMVGFWLALGMANGARCAPKLIDTRPKAGYATGEPEVAPQIESRVSRRRHEAQRAEAERFPRWTQPLLLMLAVVLAATALLPQSRGALWTFFLVLPFFVIFSANRFRALVDVAIVAAPVVIFWGRLNAPYLAISNGTPLNTALTTQLVALGYSAAVVLGAWLVSWLIERWIGPLSRKAVVWIGVALAAAAIFAAAGGIVYADMRTDGLDTYLSDRWQEATDDGQAAADQDTRFEGVGLNGRWQTWQLAVDAFEQEPVFGLGAQNFETFFYQHRQSLLAQPQPNSQPLRLLAELGLPGAILWVVFVLAALVYAAIVRFRSSVWAGRVLLAAMVTAFISWFIHSSVDWSWQLAGVTLPAIMLAGALVGAGKAPKTRLATPTGVAVPAPVAETDTPLGTIPLLDAEMALQPAPAQTTRRPRRASKSGRSVVVRILAVLIALAALAAAALPYVSLRYSSLAADAVSLQDTEAWADTAATLDPTSIEPAIARADAYRAAAAATPSAADKVQLLRRAAGVWMEAVALEPDNWVCRLGAADALVAAGEYALILDRTLVMELRELARTQLDEAHRLNPLSPEVEALQARLTVGVWPQ